MVEQKMRNTIEHQKRKQKQTQTTTKQNKKTPRTVQGAFLRSGVNGIQ